MSIVIVVEIGINHNGDMGICKQLIDVAAEAPIAVNLRQHLDWKK
tara:strand:- start:681 stop:815 length:135 start_codon:yes stop_codon:yes gene_type:complete